MRSKEQKSKNFCNVKFEHFVTQPQIRDWDSALSCQRNAGRACIGYAAAGRRPPTWKRRDPGTPTTWLAGMTCETQVWERSSGSRWRVFKPKSYRFQALVHFWVLTENRIPLHRQLEFLENLEFVEARWVILLSNQMRKEAETFEKVTSNRA